MNKLMKQPFMRMFLKKRKSKTKGTMLASLIGIGISAAVFGVKKGQRRETTLPLQNVMKNFTPKTNNINLMDNAALAEFSEELLTSALNKDRSMNQENK